MEKGIVLSKRDVTRLRSLMRNAHTLDAADREHRLDLLEELERAFSVEDAELPTNIVAMDATVLVRDLETNVATVYTVVVPSQADLSLGRVSVFAPLGTALLGYSTGDEVQWSMPGGLRRLKIEAVAQAKRTPEHPRPERSGRYRPELSNVSQHVGN
jgi:regulator of nucleoside diphosphate kinase